MPKVVLRKYILLLAEPIATILESLISAIEVNFKLDIDNNLLVVFVLRSNIFKYPSELPVNKICDSKRNPEDVISLNSIII